MDSQMYVTKSDANEGGTYIGDIPGQHLQTLGTLGKKTRSNKAVFHDL